MARGNFRGSLPRYILSSEFEVLSSSGEDEVLLTSLMRISCSVAVEGSSHGHEQGSHCPNDDGSNGEKATSDEIFFKELEEIGLLPILNSSPVCTGSVSKAPTSESVPSSSG